MILPTVVTAIILALSGNSPTFKITIQEGAVYKDIAQTSRTMGRTYEETIGCAIMIDSTALSKTASVLRAKGTHIKEKTLREFVLIHELAHCYDAVPPPQGVDPIEWREFFADIYSVLELVNAEKLPKWDYDKLIKVREIDQDPFPVIAIRDLREVVHGSRAQTSLERVRLAKIIREQHFKSRAKY